MCNVINKYYICVHFYPLYDKSQKNIPHSYSSFSAVYACIRKRIFSRGLYFHSFELDQDKRTGLNLTPDGKINMPGGFKLQFDIKLRQNRNNYGYVFRLISNDSVNVDFISHDTTQDYLTGYAFSLVSGANSLVKVKSSDLNVLKLNFWYKGNTPRS